MTTPARDPQTGKFIDTTPGAQDGTKGADGKTKVKEEKAKAETPAMMEFSRRFAGTEEKPKDDKSGGTTTTTTTQEPPPKKAAPKREPTATEKLLERTTNVLETVVKTLPSKEKKEDTIEKDKDQDPIEKLDADTQRVVRVLRQMEKDYADKYKGISQRYIDGQQALEEYASTWEKDNPGKDFNQDDDEHKDFMAKHGVTWDEDHYVESLAEMKASAKASSAIEENNRKINSELDELRRAQKLRDEQPNIEREGVSATRNFWKLLGDEFAEIVKPDGTVDNAKLTELNKTRDIAIGIGIQAAERVEGMTQHMYKLVNGLTKFDEKNQVHTWLSNFAVLREQDFMSMPPEDRIKDGKAFKPRAEYRALSEEERKKYWTFSAADFGYMIGRAEAAHAAKAIKAEEEQFKSRLERRGIKLEEKSNETPPRRTELPNKTGNEEDEAGDENTIDEHGKPRGPSSTPPSKVAAAADKGKPQKSDAVTSFMNKQLGKS